MKAAIITFFVLCSSVYSADNNLKMVSKMYSSGLARGIGDLVTILISESSSSSKSESLSTGKTATKGLTDPIFPESQEGKFRRCSFVQSLK